MNTNKAIMSAVTVLGVVAQITRIAKAEGITLDFNWRVEVAATERYEYTSPVVNESSTSWEKIRDNMWWVFLANTHPGGTYRVDQYKVYLDAPWRLPSGVDYFEEMPEVIYKSSNGYSGANPNSQENWAEVEYWDYFSIRMYTFVYWVEYNSVGQAINEWWPRHPGEVTFSYRVRGVISQPDMVSGAESGTGSLIPGDSYFTTAVSLTLAPPHGGTLSDVHPVPDEDGDYDDNEYVVSGLTNEDITGNTYSALLIAVPADLGDNDPPYVSVTSPPWVPWRGTDFKLSASDSGHGNHGILGWEFEIKSEAFQLVRHFQDLGEPPSILHWDWRDEAGVRVPNGTYWCFFSAWDNCLNEGSAPPKVARVSSTSSIPTISEWGLIVMAVLVLTAGSVVIWRRRKTRLA